MKTARSFNDKEEEVALLYLENNQEQYRDRMDYLNGKIDIELSIAVKKLDSIKPLLNITRIIRSFGMIFFFSMIITSALVINGVLALFVLLATILVAVIMNIDQNRRIKKVKKLNFHLPKKKSHRRVA